MLHLDIINVAGINALLYFSIAFGFSLLHLVAPRHVALRFWTASLWLTTAALVIMALQSSMPALVSIVLRNLLSAVANVLMLACICLFLHQRPPWVPAAVSVVLYLAGILWFSLVTPDLGMRLVLFSIAFFGWKFWAASILLRSPRIFSRISVGIAAVMFILSAIASFLRAFIPVPNDVAMDLTATGIHANLMHFGNALFGFGLSFAVILLLIEQQTAALRKLSRTDSLTGTLNRAALLSDGTLQLQLCQRQQRPFSALMMDLDHFKSINDLHGHRGGDQALLHFIQILRQDLRSYDVLLGRYGGEEFVLLLPGVAGNQAHELAARLCKTLAQHPAVLNAKSVTITCSFGISEATPDCNLEQLLAHADRALYQAKSSGRNRVARFDADCVKVA